MFTHIYESEVAVVDITLLNPNVFYEMGIRHALKKNVTILIRKKGTPAPFNIAGFSIIEYDMENPDSLKKGMATIQDLIKTGLADVNRGDSPIYEVLDNLKVENKPKSINKKEVFTFDLANVEKKIGIITGDLQNIEEADVWVNSENTNMMMARPFERSISAVIRYKGAKKNKLGEITADLIANELQETTGGRSVNSGIVIDTGSGELSTSNKVKKIFHAAAVIGQLGQGYSPIPNISECVRNALVLMDDLRLKDDKLETILFPLMGTGTSRLSAQEITFELIDEAVSYLEENKDSRVKTVYFLAHTDQDLDICRRVLRSHKGIKRKEG
jgi:O-acetyl-ADP-ribose deacetylase (regulator of RNase III)